MKEQTKKITFVTLTGALAIAGVTCIPLGGAMLTYCFGGEVDPEAAKGAAKTALDAVCNNGQIAACFCSLIGGVSALAGAGAALVYNVKRGFFGAKKDEHTPLVGEITKTGADVPATPDMLERGTVPQ